MKMMEHELTKESNPIIHGFLVLLFFSVLYTIFFSPVIFAGKLLAPNDGIAQNLPAFYSARTLWTDLLYGGFPLAAEPQTQSWYPLSLILSLIPNSWNTFVISAYVLASCFTYGYVYTITKSKLAAIASGIIYGMSGFMMAHLAHTNMIHAAAWMPLMIWALEKLRQGFSIKWFAIACLAIACCILAGHPQIAVYGLGMSGLYVLALGWNAPMGRWKYYRLCASAIFLGIALGAIQILPTIELMNLGLRTEYSFQDFNSFSLPLNQTILLLFPWIMGGGPFQNVPYSGAWNLAEITGYVGILPLILATIGFIAYRNNFTTRFWLIIAFLTFLLTLGDATPLAWLMYHLPGYNKFRVPARHFIEMTLALSILAGYGIAAIQRQVFSNRLMLKILISAGVVLISSLGIYLSLSYLQSKPTTKEKIINLFSLSNPTVSIPILIFVVAALILIYSNRLSRFRLGQFVLVLFLVIDLGSFGWFSEWHNYSPSIDALKPPASAQKYAKTLNNSQQRILPIRGVFASRDEIPVNLSRLWGVPSASGYGPLILSRVSQIFPMNAAGGVERNWASEVQRSLDIMSVRYVFFPKGSSLLFRPVRRVFAPKSSSSVSSIQGINWSSEIMSTSLGSGCNNPEANSVKFLVPSDKSIPQTITAIGIVSTLGCSTGVPNNAEVLQVRLTDDSGKVATQNLRAGRDTSEWAYDCGDVLPSMQHSRSPIFESFPVERNGVPKCEGHNYVSILPVDKLSKVKSIELNWVGTSGTINIQKISLINENTKQSYPIIEDQKLLVDTAHWHHVEDINQATVYENLRAMPRTWLVPEVIKLKPEEVLRAIQSSKLPDSRSYEPSKIALVEEDFDFKAQNFDIGATTKFVKLNDTHVQVQTNSLSPAFLVLSDIYYPGWQAKLDGKKIHLFQTNYVLRGVLLPEGNHVVDFEFKPTSFHVGAGISVASLCLLGYLWVKKRSQ